MTVDSAVSLCEGELITSPSISSFNNIAIDITQVTRGSLFLAINSSDIYEAVQKGAYGIIFERPIQIMDHEIAWIKVTSLQQAIIRFLKFYIIASSNKFYLANSFQIEVLSTLTTSTKIITLKSSIIQNYTLITTAPSNTLFISKDEKLLTLIAPSYIPLKQYIETDFVVIKSSVFETSFKYHDRYYEFIKVPRIYIDDFIKLLSLLDSQFIPYLIDEVDYTNHFYPVFVNKNLQAKEFGESDRVIIFEPDNNYIEKSITFLEQNLKWANCIYIFNTKDKATYSHINQAFFFDNKYEIIDFLKKLNFNFAYIAGDSFTSYKEELTYIQPTQGLLYV